MALASSKRIVKRETLSLRIETWPIGKVLAYAKNARMHSPQQITAIAASITEFGFINPCLVDAEGVLIAGHGRILACQSIGMKTVPVIRLGHLTEQQARALRIADNALPMLASWDAALIGGEIGSLKLEGYEIALLGFPEAQLRGWGISVGTDGEQDPELVPEVPTRPTSRAGDLWKLGTHRVLCGDATKAKDVALVMGDSKPNLMASDPPYGINYDPGWRAERGVNHNKKKMGEVRNDDQADWSAAYKLFDGNVIYAWSADLRSRQCVEALEKVGFVPVAQIIWAKDRFALGRGDYHFQHEPCWYAVRAGKNHAWNGGRSQTTVWSIPARDDGGHGHSTQKPIECMKRPIENNSRKGDFVYDPFLGSGTTVIAAEMTGRKCLGLEIDAGYVDVIVLRWEAFTGKKAVLAATGRTYAETKAARSKGRPEGKRTQRAAVPDKTKERPDDEARSRGVAVRGKRASRPGPKHAVPAGGDAGLPSEG